MKKIVLLTLTLLSSQSALAAEAAASVGGSSPVLAVAAALAIGIAAMGGALGQGKVGAAAMEGLARNPQSQKSMFVPMIIALALIESLVIYALVIAFQIVGKI